MLKTIIRFGVVGILNSLIDYTIFEILVNAFSVHAKIFIFICSLISGGIAIINSYFWNKRWTFKDKNKDYVRQFIQFALLSIVSLIINALLVVLFSSILPVRISIGAHGVKSIYITKVLAIAITMVFNFITYRAFVFTRKGGDGEEYVYVVD